MQKRAFTLVEIVIAIAIASLIISGLSAFLIKVNNSIFSAQNKTNVAVDMAEFMEKTNIFRTRFSSGFLIDAPLWYDAIVFTNANETAWALLGVVDASSSSGWYVLDSTGSYLDYGKKVLAVQELTASQVAQAKTETGVYSIVFQPNSLYNALTVKEFSAVSYQSGAIFDVWLDVYDTYYSRYLGKSVVNFPYGDDFSHFQLDF